MTTQPSRTAPRGGNARDRRRPGRTPARVLLLPAVLGWLAAAPSARAADVLPRHVTPEAARAVQRGLDALARTQGPDGAWTQNRGGEAYPVAVSSVAGMAFLAGGNTPTRGPYAQNVRSVLEYLIGCTTKNGLITGPSQDSGRPMHGHGFALLFLASSYGMVTNERQAERIRAAVERAIDLTARAQSRYGGWTYIPGSGDEGSVTVTQVQALRAAHNAGFHVPPAVIEEAVRYIERCSTPEGGICYSLGSGGGPRLAISAAAVATLYNAGEFDSPVAERCLEWVWGRFQATPGWSKRGGHDYYTHLYASQGFYMAGDKYWDGYFPATRDELVRMQGSDGGWEGDGIGPAFGTGIACTILQLPYKYLPVYQR